MKLSAPTKVLFYISFVVFIIDLLVELIPALGFTTYGIWVEAIAYIILMIGVVTKGK